MCEFISGSSVPLHCPACLSLFQFHVAFITCFVLEVEVRDSHSHRNSHIIEISSCILRFLLVQINLGIALSLWRIDLEFWWVLHWICILLLVRWSFFLLILLIHEYARSFHLLRSLNSFLRHLKFLSNRSFTCLVRVTYYCDGCCFPNFILSPFILWVEGFWFVWVNVISSLFPDVVH